MRAGEPRKAAGSSGAYGAAQRAGRRRRRWAAAWLCAGVVCCELGAQQLIVHPALGLEAMDGAMARAVFTMRLRRWPDNTPVRVFVLPDRHPVHREFAKTVLGVFPHQLRRAWDRLVFSGTGQAPTQVEDEAEMLEWVAHTPGAVGYVSDPTVASEVRNLSLE